MKARAPAPGQSRSRPVNVPERLTQHAGFLMHKAGQRGLQVVNESLAGLGIDVKHYSVLSVLVEGPCSQIGLSTALGVDRTSMVQLLDELEARKLVQRTINPKDRRAHVLKATRRGRAMAVSGHTRTKQGDEAFLSRLTSEEKGELRAILLKLL